MRIIPDELWSAAEDRQKHTRHEIAASGNLAAANRPWYLFSGLTKGKVCGAGFIMGSANRLCCFGARDQGTCSNKLTIRRGEVEVRVLKALQEKLLRQDLFDEFCDEFTREMNRLRMEHRASLSATERELERVQNGIRRVIEAIKNGFAGPDLSAEWNALRERKTALQAKLESADEPPPLLHPGMAELYRQRVIEFAQALEHRRADRGRPNRFATSSRPSSSRPPRAPWKRTSSTADAGPAREVRLKPDTTTAACESN